MAVSAKANHRYYLWDPLHRQGNVYAFVLKHIKENDTAAFFTIAKKWGKSLLVIKWVNQL